MHLAARELDERAGRYRVLPSMHPQLFAEIQARPSGNNSISGHRPCSSPSYHGQTHPWSAPSMKQWHLVLIMHTDTQLTCRCLWFARLLSSPIGHGAPVPQKLGDAPSCFELEAWLPWLLGICFGFAFKQSRFLAF